MGFFFKKNLKGLLTGFFILATGILASAFFWLPVFGENQFLNSIFLFHLHNSFHDSFVSWQQLFHLPWVNTTDFDGLSFQIGIFHFILALLPLIFILKIIKKNHPAVLHYFFFLAVTATAIFLILPSSYIIWDHFRFSRFIQFPWRLLTIINFAISFLAGSVMMVFNTRFTNFILLTALLLIIGFSVKLFWPVHLLDIDQTSIRDNLSNIPYLGEGRTTPKWIMVPPLKAPLQKFEFVNGQGEIEEDNVISAIQHLTQINAKQPSLICFHSFYFPGWHVFIDGQETKIYPNNPYGVILFLVPQGEHMVKVIFSTTPIRMIAQVVSWIGLALLGLAMFWRPRFKF